MATIYNPWQNTETSPLAGEFITPVLLDGELPEESEESEDSMESGAMKQALETIMQQSTLIGQLTAQLAAHKMPAGMKMD